jgi:exodeoxyribonuclease-1
VPSPAAATFFWHDYETWGVDPRRDRPVQFAGVRTNAELEIIEEPVNLFCRPTPDFLPQPEAVLVTGITPQKAFALGSNEAEFFADIHQQLARPGTCGVGYNSIRFDDEVTRFGLYRNFYDPYAREWQQGNSRWDILDLLRMTHALRPEGIVWPQHDDGTTSFRLESLSAANGIVHDAAHDALSDVYATLGMAQLVKRLQPKLFDFYFGLRKKAAVTQLLDVQNHPMLLHISGMYGAALGCIAPVVPLLAHPTNNNEIIVFNLRQDPQKLLAASVEEMAASLYQPRDALAPGVERIALKTVHLNKSPALAPVATMSATMTERWQIDLAQAVAYRELLLADASLPRRLSELFQRRSEFAEVDADSALYDGFIADADRARCAQILTRKPQELIDWTPTFADARLQKLYFRYRARNWPETLSADEMRKWENFCRARLLEGDFGANLTLDDYLLRIEKLLQDDSLSAHKQGLLKELLRWAQQMGF